MFKKDSISYPVNGVDKSISTNESPSGNTFLMNLVRAILILSGLKHLKTSNFWNGRSLSAFHSNGRFSVSGVR